jgi:hypothetical protein
MGWRGHVAGMVREECVQGFLRETRRKRKLGRLRRRWECNIKMGFRRIELSGMDWINLAQDGEQWWSLTQTVMNLELVSNLLLLKKDSAPCTHFFIWLHQGRDEIYPGTLLKIFLHFSVQHS